MRQNSKHLDEIEVAAIPEQTDGQIAAGCADDKCNAVMNECMSVFLHFMFINFFSQI